MERKRKFLDGERKKGEILIGLLGGIVYAVFVWGLDGFILQQINGSLPWLKFLIGTPIVMFIFMIAAWLSAKFTNLLIRSIIWMATSTLLSFLISFITFQGTEFALKTINNNLVDQINYVLLDSIRGRLFVIITMSNILFLIGGLLIESATEAKTKASSYIGWIFPILLCMLFFGGAGYVADANFNLKLREQVQSLNKQIIEASQMNSVNPTDRQKRLIRRYTKLGVDLEGKRRFIISSFDESFTQSRIIINFDGIWAYCTAINGMIGNCERLD